MADECWLFCFAAILLSSGLGMAKRTDYFNGNFSAIASSDDQDNSCSDVKQIFVMKNIGEGDLVPLREITGENLNLCSSKKTCCTEKMEERYQVIVKKDFWHMIQGAVVYFKTLITTSAAQFQDNLLRMIRSAENNTNVLFSDVYKNFGVLTKIPVEELFAHLSGFLLGRDVDLEESVSQFFDSLFPVVFHHSLNPKLKDFSDDYKECLRETQEEIKPFGSLPAMISGQLIKSFEAVRTLIQSLSLGVEVLNTTEHMDFGEQCGKALVKLTYCAHCQRLVAIKPCTGYCLNVARGCLAGVAGLDMPWGEYIGALERFSTGLIGNFNIEAVLSTLDTKISEAIMAAMENGPEISKRVKIACGYPRRAARDAPFPVSDKLQNKGRDDKPDFTFFMNLQTFVRRLSESRGFYANLADTLCNDESLVVRGEVNCWNGKGIGEYTKTIAGIGIVAQKYNPEVPPSQHKDMTVATLVDKLRHIKDMLNSKITKAPESDSYTVEGSGSGFWRYKNLGDDEDYSENGSGSGNWEDGYRSKSGESDFNFDSNDGRHRDITVRPGQAAADSGTSLTSYPSFAVSLIFIFCHFLRRL